MFLSNSTDSVSTLISKAKAIIVSVPGLTSLYPLAGQHEGEEKLISELFVLPQQFNAIFSELQKKQAEMSAAEKAEIDTLQLQFNTEMAKAVKHVDSIKERKLSSQLTEDRRKKMMDMVRKDDSKKLHSFIHNLSLSDGVLEDINYVLRNAAHFGAVSCLEVLCGPYPKRPVADIFSTGKITNKIAMHAAIKAGHANCVTVLLNTMNNHDGRMPVAQLMHGASPNRPIDELKNLIDNSKFYKVCAAILANGLNDYYESDNSQAQREEVIEIVEQLKQERLAAQSSLSFNN